MNSRRTREQASLGVSHLCSSRVPSEPGSTPGLLESLLIVPPDTHIAWRMNAVPGAPHRLFDRLRGATLDVGVFSEPLPILVRPLFAATLWRFYRQRE